MMIFVYWGILILCYFIASRLRSMASRFGFLDKSMMAAVYILVFLMGLRMGINQQVTSALATIGVQALAITLATIGGSILMIFLVRRRCGSTGTAVRKRTRRSRSTEVRRAHRISRARWGSCCR